MTSNINPDTAPRTLENYTLLQIAAEAMFEQLHARDAASAGSGALTNPSFGVDGAVLTPGNDHSSKFTTQQAKDFKENWRVVSHQPNTATGFSATLFEYIGDPLKQPTASKYVVSFRSTEFIEDAARDNQATNVLELKEGGWAFGQLADMQLWWNSAAVQAAVAGKKVDVTGYSLGGSLATSFHILHGDSINKVYTFNGAGVGTVDAGYSLRGVIDQFKAQSQLGANAGFFTDPVARAEYARLQSLFSSQPDGSANAVTRGRAVEQRDVLLAKVQGYLGYLPATFEFNSNAGANEQEFRDVA